MPVRNRDKLKAAVRTYTIDVQNALEGFEDSFAKIINDSIERNLAEAKRLSGYEPLYRVRKTPKGVTVDYDYRREMTAFAYRLMQRYVPIGHMSTSRRNGYSPGAARGSVRVYAGGEQVGGIGEIGFNEPVWLVTSVPYARRLEVGRSERGPFVISPNEPHFTERMATVIMPHKYGNIAATTFNFVTLSDGDIIKRPLGGSYLSAAGKMRGRHKRGDHAVGADIKYPALIIEPVTYD